MKKLGDGAVGLGALSLTPATADLRITKNGIFQNGSEYGGDSTPSGIIVMWSGTTSDVPSGWTLCDGNNGTPDLRDRFVVGAGNSYSAGNTGGSDNVSLSVSELPSHDHGDGNLDVDSHGHGDGSLSTSTAGSHSHSVLASWSGTFDEHNMMNRDELVTSTTYSLKDGSTSPNYSSEDNNEKLVAQSGDHSHSVSGSTGSSSPGIHGSTGSTGSGNSHENRPPYYALAYIMKK